MARKSAALLPSKRQEARAGSWAAVGIDASMTSIAAVAFGYDALTDKMTAIRYDSVRWAGETDYFKRLKDAAYASQLVLNVTAGSYVMALDNVYIAIEEPFYYGAVKAGRSGFIKQQAEINGAVKASLLRWGYTHIFEINNQQWRATVRHDGVTIRTGDQGKWDVKTWAIKAFGLPDLPDLVAGKHGGKIPRSESGWGAKAKAVQPDDIYDAAGCCAYMADAVERGSV